MSSLITDDARPLVERSETGETPAYEAHAALPVLERELRSWRRFGVGAGGTACWLVAGVALGAAADAGTGDAAILAVAGVVGLLLLALGAWLGNRAIGAGRRVAQAYRTWSAASEDPLDPSALIARQVAPRNQPRVVAGSLCLVAAIFSAAVAWLAVAPGDPATIGAGRGAMLPLGLIWLVAFGVPTVALLGSELRSVNAHAGRVVRSRQR